MFELCVLQSQQSIHYQIKCTCNPKVKIMRACMRNTELLFPAGPSIPYSNSRDVSYWSLSREGLFGRLSTIPLHSFPNFIVRT